MSEITLSKGERFIRTRIQHYNERKYWKYRNAVISAGEGRFETFFCKMKLMYIKRCDAFNNATLGTHLGFGAYFSDIPNLPHGLYGIVISHNAVIGKNVTIYHQVTIGEGKNGAPKIGDDVQIGAGAIIIGNVVIGNHVKIGAGAIVVDDIPSNATVVAQKSRVIINEYMK